MNRRTRREDKFKEYDILPPVIEIFRRKIKQKKKKKKKKNDNK